MTNALVYLAACTTRNRVLAQLRRLRTPRYAIALGLGVFYMYFVYFRPSARGTSPAVPGIGPALSVVLPLLLLLYVGYMWIFGADRYALAFSTAETAMLFPAPISRRALVLFKLVRGQAAVLMTTIIWSVVLRRSGAGLERALGFWVLLSILNAHRLGVALVRTSQSEHGMAGLRRTLLPVVVFLTAAAVLVTSALSAWPLLREASGLSDLGRVLIERAATSPVKWVLFPAQVTTAPVFAAGSSAWGRAMLAALALLALHVTWVLRTDAAFEEAAMEASAARATAIAAMRERRATGRAIRIKRPRRTLPLAATGAPAIAIIWKNALALIRGGTLRSVVILLLVGVGTLAIGTGRAPLGVIIVMTVAAALCITILVFGPMSLRVDLRGDLANIAILKTIPIPAQQIVLAEVASSAIPAAIAQTALAWLALVASQLVADPPFARTLTIGAAIGAPVLLLGLNLVNFGIHNAAALLFPAWVRPADSGAGGIEMMGQTMLTTIATLIVLALLSLGPAAAGAGVFYVFRSAPSIAALASAIAAGMLLCAESWLLSDLLASSLEKLEPSQLR